MLWRSRPWHAVGLTPSLTLQRCEWVVLGRLPSWGCGCLVSILPATGRMVEEGVDVVVAVAYGLSSQKVRRFIGGCKRRGLSKRPRLGERACRAEKEISTTAGCKPRLSLPQFSWPELLYIVEVEDVDGVSAESEVTGTTQGENLNTV